MLYWSNALKMKSPGNRAFGVPKPDMAPGYERRLLSCFSLAPFDARVTALQPQMACHEPRDPARDRQAGKALVRKLSPRVEWWPQRDSNPRFRLERAAS